LAGRLRTGVASSSRRARITGAHKRSQGSRPAAAVKPAKITPPRLRNIYQRERVFELLDQRVDRQVLWVSAPAGFGKTTAVATWLQRRGYSAIWYHCDEGDGDIASFFHFATLALRAQPGARSAAVPALSPELHAALPTFTRNYFRAFCAALRTHTVLVLDNWQSVPSTAPLRELLPIAIGELTADLTLIVISREEPDSNLIRLRSAGRVGELNWPSLQLTQVETEAIAVLYARNATQVASLSFAALCSLTQGWAAGVAMLLRAETSSVSAASIASMSTQDAFDYLATEVFDRLEAAERDFLMKTALVEPLTVPIAAQMTQESRSQQILDRLVRSNTFTQFRQASASYHYHPLFRSFLCTRATQRFTADEWRGVQLQAARCLIDGGQAEGAISHLLKAGDREHAQRLVLELTPALIAQGRYRTVEAQIAAVSGPMPPNSGWLLYWSGVAHMAIDFPASRPRLESAYQAFVREAEVTGQLLAVAAILQQIFIEFGDYGRLIPWIDVLEKLLQATPRFLSSAVELQVVTGLLTAIFFARPRQARIDWCCQRIEELLRAERDPMGRSAAAAILLNYFALSGQLARARAWLTGGLLSQKSIGPNPSAQAQHLWLMAYLDLLGGELAQARARLEAAAELAQHHGLPSVELRCRLSRLQTLDFDIDAREIQTELARLAPAFANQPALLQGHFKFACSLFWIAHQDFARAERELYETDALCSDASFPQARAMITTPLAEALCGLGRFDAAREQLNRGRLVGGDLDQPQVDFSSGLLQAEIAWRTGMNEEAENALRRALAVGRAQRFAHAFISSSLLKRLLADALERGIEVDYCRWVIRTRAWAPPSPDAMHWPWPVQIRTLGGFEVRLDDAVLRFAHKQQRRPLNLLKALATDAKGVHRALLIDQLWPDLDGDAARGTFDMAIHRLRKLLTRSDAVLVSDGHVSLNPAVVWVDAHALERTVAATTRGRGERDEPAVEARRLLQIYAGPFLAEDAQPWFSPTRERLRGLFLRRIEVLGSRLRALHRWDDLAELYESALEREPLAAEIHSGLMESLIAQDRVADARDVYARYRQRLARTSGAAPPVAMQRLYQRLQ
jgi:LuxR family maltose regulon positive regulatory protein